MKRKPMKVGLDYVRGPEWKPKLFTRKGAQRYMDQKLPKCDLRNVPGCTALVADCGEYWRGNICAGPVVGVQR